MAGIFKRPPAVTGQPAVPTPANTNLPAFQQAINNIRARLEKLDAAVNQAYLTANASSSADAVAVLQTQVAVLNKQLENLAAQIAAATGTRQPTYLAMQMGDDAEDGQPGPPGPPGERGERGHTLLMDPDEHEQHLVIGPPGPPGPPGSMMVLDLSECCGGDDFPVGFPPAEATSGSSSLTATHIGYGNGSNVLTGTSTFTWTNSTLTMQIGAGTGPSTLRTANASSGANAASLTIQTGDAASGVVGAGLLAIQGGAGAGASAGGSIAITAGNNPSTGDGGSVTITSGTSSGGTAGNFTVVVNGTTRLGISNTGAATFQSTISGTSVSFTSGVFSSTLECTSIRVTGSTAPANGVYLQAAGVVGLAANSTAAYKYGSNAFLSQSNNTRDLGEVTINWRDIFSQNAVTVASDVRNKTEVRTCELGLDFVLANRPVSYRQIVGSNRVEVLDDEAHTHVVTPVPGVRRHYGFIAQEVREVLSARGMDGADFAGWCTADVNDPDAAQALRYSQFIPPVYKAVQEIYQALKDRNIL